MSKHVVFRKIAIGGIFARQFPLDWHWSPDIIDLRADRRPVRNVIGVRRVCVHVRPTHIQLIIITAWFRFGCIAPSPNTLYGIANKP